MAHREQMSFVESVKNKFPHNFVSGKVLEIGSYNINGSVRQFFDNCVYVGLDVFPGNCVDIVCSGHLYAASDKTFDCCISCECFEHNPFWKETFLNMFRMLKMGGLIVFTCATTGRPEHGTKRTSPLDSLTTNIEDMQDYYLNLTEEDFSEFKSMFSSYEFSTNENTHDLYFYGIK